MKKYLFDQKFLKELDYSRTKETYIRIISLTNDEYPREQIEGKVTGGSISIDGASAVRRSCSLSMIALDNDKIITDKFWCYDNKFKLEIGIKNLVDNKYPDIIWFDMGIYIITSFSKSQSTTELNISLSGKDKMCRLNGEVSGNIMMSTDFGTKEKVQKNEETGELTTVIEKLPIYMIIQNAVKEYGQERAENIIINDLDQWGYELWEYRGNEPMYLFILPGTDGDNPSVINMTFNGDTSFRFTDSLLQVNWQNYLDKYNQQAKEKWEQKNPDSDYVPLQGQVLSNYEAVGGKFFSMNTLDLDYNENATLIEFGTSLQCYVAKIEYGETAGYHRIPLIYNNDLILNAGETVTSLLDKIKAMLGDFEYFYDLQGRFVFQKKNTYIQELFSPIDGELVTPMMHASQYSYKFEDEKLFTAISNSPNINNLKNDFAIWGTRKSATGDDLPIHARYALDKKPTRYKSLDWYYKPGEKYKNGETEIIVTKANSVIKESSAIYVTKAKNSNEIEMDWRELIYRMAIDFYRHNEETDYLINLEKANPQFIDGKTGYEQYYSDLQGFWRQLYNPMTTDNDKLLAEVGGFEYYNSKGSDGNGNDAYWNKQIHLDPNTLNFWFDFLDTEGDLGNYSVKKIGARSKVINETSVKSIYFRETPEVLFIVSPKETVEEIQMAYMPIWIQDSMEGLFYRSAQGMAAVSKANELIYQHTATVEGISLTSVPIYYLQPNTRIYVKDQGDYTLDKISYSLTYNGTMTLSGSKILKQFY